MDRFEACKIIIKAIKLNNENKFQKLAKQGKPNIIIKFILDKRMQSSVALKRKVIKI